jgi:AraC family transcriptional regulator
MEILEKNEFKLVGYDIETSVQGCSAVLPDLWIKFMQDLDKIKGKKGEYNYGLCRVTGECSFRYVASVEVENFDGVPEGMVKEVVPPQKYAKFTHRGKLTELGKTYWKIQSKLLPESGLKQKKDFWFELYDDRFDQISDDSEMDIYIPIKE